MRLLIFMLSIIKIDMTLDIETFKQEVQLLPEHAQQALFNYMEFLKWKHERQLKEGKTQKPQFGCGSVKGELGSDFDEPLEDFKEYME